MNPPPLTIENGEFARFQDLFYRKTGIVFGESKRYFVDRRLTERMTATGCQSFGDYLNILRFCDPQAAEMQNLVNIMTVNETYFYREAYQFRCLVDSMLPELVRGRSANDPIQIWSMPCSTGEEPYSLAIFLLENWPHVDEYDLRLLATDIDTRTLEHARAGIYDARSVQHVPPRALSRYFTSLGKERWQVIKDLRASVEFRQANISSEADTRRYQQVDVIFCRNLLIYFDDASRRKAAAALYDALRPGGFICLGHSESMSRISSLFVVRKFADAIVYQRPLS